MLYDYSLKKYVLCKLTNCFLWGFWDSYLLKFPEAPYHNVAALKFVPPCSILRLEYILLLLECAIRSQWEFFNDLSFKIKVQTACLLHLSPHGQWPWQYYLFFSCHHRYFSGETFSVDIPFLWSYRALWSCSSCSEQLELENKRT